MAETPPKTTATAAIVGAIVVPKVRRKSQKSQTPAFHETENFSAIESAIQALPAAWRYTLMNAGPDDLERLERMIEKAAERRKLDVFVPTPKQLEFIGHGKNHRVRLLRAGNRSGKSEGAAYEMACHLTGRYPADWQGHRFAKPIIAWAACETAELTRDVQQHKLVGPFSRRSEWGTGLIPAEDLDLDHVAMRHGTPDAIDTISVKHASGGWSTLSFKAHSQGREKFQGASCDLVWLDEECALEIFSECVTRLATVRGLMMLTFTPLSGVTKLVSMFEGPEPLGKMVQATLYDASFMTDEDRENLIKSWPEHERKARIFGIPFLGSGLVFPVPEHEYVVEPFEVPRSWKQISGMDLGIDHPAAFVRIAWNDPRAGGDDCVYVIATHRVKDATPMAHAAAVMPWGRWMPWAWPHDGNRRGLTGDGTSLETFRDMYERYGLRMLDKHATHEKGGNNVEQSIAEILERMQTGRLKIFSDQQDLLNEIRFYSRKDGVIQAIRDDLTSALRYAVMMLRHAVLPGSNGFDSNWDQPVRRNIKRLA